MKVDKETNCPFTFVTTSAPGKVLVSGGYLVLESPNIGLVLAVDSRFHSTVGIIPGCEGKEEQPSCDGLLHNNTHYFKLDVHSPQFSSVLYYYLMYEVDSNNASNHANHLPIQLIPRNMGLPQKQKDNPFIENTLVLAFAFIRNTMSPSSFHEFVLTNLQGNTEAVLAIKLRADNDFYSQIPALRERRLERTSLNMSLLPKFLPPSLPVRKTGLGSSAALVTCLLGSLLRYFNLVALPVDNLKLVPDKEESELRLRQKQLEGLRIVHNLSQICHCWAQGKIGSGFDVSSAVYGSQVYSRFNPDLLSELLAQPDDGSSSPYNKGLQLVNLVQDSNMSLWDSTVIPLVLPKGIELVMADVCGGSESPSMATNIMVWKKKALESGINEDIMIWKGLACVNEQIQKSIQIIINIEESLDEDMKQKSWNLLKNSRAEQWVNHSGDVSLLAQPLFTLRTLFLEARSLLRKMGSKAGVPVEPESQTVLANSTMEIPGVVAAGVPGAGGNDALFVLYIRGVDSGNEPHDDVVRDRIGTLWKDWSYSHKIGEDLGSTIVVCPLLARHVRFGDGLIETDNLSW